MDADEPRFQIGEDEMDDRQIVLGNLWVAALGNGKVFIPALAEAGISTPIVSDGQRPRSNGALHEPTKRVGAPIGYYGEPDTPGIASVLSLVLRGSRFPMTNLDGTSDENLVVDTPAFAASPSTNPCLVYLNMFPRLAADTILIGPHHASAELVENAEGRLIARQAKLSLKLNRRDAGRLAGDQISRPKPCAQRHMAAFHDGANRQARIVAALATAQDTGTSGDAEGIACGMAMRTDEAVAPSSFFHVGSTLRFIGKKLLKLWKRPRKGQVVTLKDVHGSLSIIHTKSIPSGCMRQADRQGTDDLRAEQLADALLSILTVDQQRQAERLFRASDNRAEALSPETLRFIATAEHVAAHLELNAQLEWSPAVIGLCKAVETEVVSRLLRPLATMAGTEDLTDDKSDKDIGRVAAFCAEPGRKPPELGSFAHFLQTVIHSRKRRQTSKLISCFIRLSAAWTGSTWLLVPDGLHRALTHLTVTYRNRAAHIDELSRGDYLGCRDITIGSQGVVWKLITSTERHK